MLMTTRFVTLLFMPFHQLCRGWNGLLCHGTGRSAAEIPSTHQSSGRGPESWAADRSIQVRDANVVNQRVSCCLSGSFWYNVMLLFGLQKQCWYWDSDEITIQSTVLACSLSSMMANSTVVPKRSASWLEAASVVPLVALFAESYLDTMFVF